MSLALVETGPLTAHPLAEIISAEVRKPDTWDLRAFGYDPRRGRWLHFRRRKDSRSIGATSVSQDWLLAVTQEWVFRNALRKVGARYLADTVQAMALLSKTLRERPDAGENPRHLSRADLHAHLERLGQLRETTLLSSSGHALAVRHLGRVLEDMHRWGLTAEDGPAAGLPDSFVVTKSDRPRTVKKGPDEPGKAIPRVVMRQVLADDALALLERMSGSWAVRWFKLSVATGRRPGEIVALPLDGCLDSNVELDEHGNEVSRYVLVHDMSKVTIVGYRLPISEATADVIHEQRRCVLDTYPDTPAGQLPLFPSPWNNPAGRMAVNTQQTSLMLRNWVRALPQLQAPAVDEDGRASGRNERGEFRREQVYPRALRHTWAQDHADAGTPLEVLQDLMGHEKPTTTQIYYRLTQSRRRQQAQPTQDWLDRFSRLRRFAGNRK